MPPWPSIMMPQSLAPRLRFTADKVRPPSTPMTTMTNDMSNDCCQVKGVIHHMAPPTAVVVNPPPTRPSTVFDGLTCGASLVLPKSLPNTYCNQSLNCTIKSG